MRVCMCCVAQCVYLLIYAGDILILYKSSSLASHSLAATVQKPKRIKHQEFSSRAALLLTRCLAENRVETLTESWTHLDFGVKNVFRSTLKVFLQLGFPTCGNTQPVLSEALQAGMFSPFFQQRSMSLNTWQSFPIFLPSCPLMWRQLRGGEGPCWGGGEFPGPPGHSGTRLGRSGLLSFSNFIQTAPIHSCLLYLN